MSKTKGNVIDPLVITEQYGADALRFTLAALTAQGRDIKLAKERIEGYRGFANKLWNATRFALMNLAGYTARDGSPAAEARTPADRWILARLQRAVNDTVEALEGYRFNDAASTVYQFVWHELCDWYIELAKEALYGEDARTKRGAQAVLTHCLDVSLRLLHPLMPFITEELWQTLKAQVSAPWADSIMIAPYPPKGDVDATAEASFGPVIGIVDALRNIRGEMNIAFKVPLRDVQVGALSPEALHTVREEMARIQRLANAASIEASALQTRKVPASAVAVGSGFEVRVPLAGVVDMAGENARIAKELAKVDGDLGGIEKKLANPSFVARAPAEVVEKDRARAEELREKRRRLEAHRAMLAEAEDGASGAEAPAPTSTATEDAQRSDPFALSGAPAMPTARFDSGRSAASAQRERDRSARSRRADPEDDQGTTPPTALPETAHVPKARGAAAKPKRKAAKHAPKTGRGAGSTRPASAKAKSTRKTPAKPARSPLAKAAKKVAATMKRLTGAAKRPTARARAAAKPRTRR
jgi:valyl-tRNA synthetase